MEREQPSPPLFKSDLPKSYRPFRHLTEREETRLTLAMAFRCKDGVVVAADIQGLTERGHAEEMTKIYRIPGSERSLLTFTACLAKTSAMVFIRLEFAMQGIYPEEEPRKWANFSTDFVSRFCDVLLHILPKYEATVEGAQIFTIRVNGKTKKPEIRQPSPFEIRGEGLEIEPLKAFMRRAKQEIPPFALVRLLNEFDVFSPSIRKLLSTHSSWDF